MKMGIWILTGALAMTAACSRSEHAGHAKTEQKQALFHCPMHPTYTSDKAGECPICGMNLVPIENEGGGEGEGGIEGQGKIKINPRRRQLIGLKTEAAQVRSLVKVIRTVGRIAYDPELYRTQEEYLTALASYRRISAGSGTEAAQRAKTLVDSSRLRLNIMGISNAQIAVLAEQGKPDVGLLLSQGKGQKLWLYADVYESDLAVVTIGQTVNAVSSSLPGKKFSGQVKAIDPTINPKTRSVRVRVLVSDPEGVLRPDMYLNAQIQVDLGNRLSVPVESIVDSGIRQILFVDDGEGYITPREARLGVRNEDHVEIKEGVKEGEHVVTSGNFLIDSESKLKAAISAIAGGGHAH